MSFCREQAKHSHYLFSCQANAPKFTNDCRIRNYKVPFKFKACSGFEREVHTTHKLAANDLIPHVNDIIFLIIIFEKLSLV